MLSNYMPKVNELKLRNANVCRFTIVSIAMDERKILSLKEPFVSTQLLICLVIIRVSVAFFVCLLDSVWTLESIKPKALTNL